METCVVCTKKVYPTERVAADATIYHKSCFRCETCKGVLKLGSYASMEGRTFCKPCFKKSFFTKGNYSEGFGKLKPQQEHDLKSGKTAGGATNSPAQDSFDAEKKRQEEEEKKRKEELKKKQAEQPKVEEKKPEERKDKSEEFRKRQEAFEKEKAEEREREAQKRKEEDRARLFEETRSKREESMKKVEEEKKTERKDSVTKSTPSPTTGTNRANNIFLKNDAEKKNPSTTPSSSPQIRTPTSTTSKPSNETDSKRVKELQDELDEAKSTIADLQKQLESRDKEIEKLEDRNRELQEKLDNSSNDHTERTQHKELEENDVAAN